MFWSKKKKPDTTKKIGKHSDEALPAGQGSSEPLNGSNKQGVKAGQRPGSEEIRTQALANARAARERIGEDTIQKIAAALAKKQSSAMEQAKNKINKAESGRLRDEIRFLMDEE